MTGEREVVRKEEGRQGICGLGGSWDAVAAQTRGDVECGGTAVPEDECRGEHGRGGVRKLGSRGG